MPVLLIRKHYKALLLTIAAFAIVIIVPVSLIKASENALPGEKLYGIKLFKEELTKSLILASDKKLEYDLNRAEERLEEITLITGQILVSSGKTSQKPNTKKAGLVLQATDENTPQAKVVNLSVDEMVKQAGLYLNRMESIRQDVRRELEESRQARDVVKTICLDDKLNQLDVALRSANERYDALKSAARRGDKDLASHEFVILTVLKERSDQLGAEAKQCVGKEVGIIGESSVKVEVDTAPFQEPEEIIESFPVDEQKLEALRYAWKKYTEIVGELPKYLSDQQKVDIINTFLQTLTNQQNAINNLMPFVPPQGLPDLDNALSKVEEVSEGALSKTDILDPAKSVEIRRGLIGKEAETLAGYFDPTCENNLKINGFCMKGATNRNGIYISGYANLVNELTVERINSVPWMQNEDYLESIRSNQIEEYQKYYEEDIDKYQDKVYSLSNNKEEQALFASQMFNHWLAFSAMPYSKDTSELAAVAKINEGVAIAGIASTDKVAAAGVNMMLLDRGLKVLIDEADQPIQDVADDYSQRVSKTQQLIEVVDENLSDQIILSNEELVRRGLMHGIILTAISPELTPEEEDLISELIDDLSDAVADGVATIKEKDPELYESKKSYYQPLSQGLQQGLMQGLSQGLQQGIQQGLNQGINQGLQQGLQAGLQSGIQAGVQAGLQAGLQSGLQAGLQSGLQQGIYKSFYESFLEELERPPNESWIGGDGFGGEGFGGDSFGGDGFGGDYFGSNGFGGDSFGGEGFEGSDFGSSTTSTPTSTSYPTPTFTPPSTTTQTPGTTSYSTPTPPSENPPPPPPDPATACVQNGCNWTGSTCQCP